MINNCLFYYIIILCVFVSIISFYITKKAFLILQLDGYNNQKYFKYLKISFNNYLKIVVKTCLISVVFSIFLTCIFTCFINNEMLYFITLSLSLIIFLTCINLLKKEHSIITLKYTKRIIRLYILYSIIYFFICVLLFVLSVSYLPLIKLSIISLLPLFAFLIIPLSNLIIMPVECLIKYRYKRKAIKKLGDFKHLIKIGITGSYGKTSTKFILNKMLSQKYNVCISPKSYNTPMGLVKVILNNLKPYHDVLICEMGANVKNDIKKLCNFINPNYGIITAVGFSHLSTFKTVEALQATKYQLVESVTQNNGTMIFNLDSDVVANFYNRASCNKVCVSCDNFKADIFAINIEYNFNFTKFTLVFPCDRVECETKLVGKGNLQDILMASALAYKLGVKVKDIQSSIMQLEPIPHRIEIKKCDNHYIIDDSFNSNYQGAENALNILSLYNGCKIIVTPGIVELGEKAYIQNYELGQKIAKVADVCIVVNQTNKKALIEGIDNKIKTYSVDAFKDAENIISKLKIENCCILYENDLPDNYI